MRTVGYEQLQQGTWLVVGFISAGKPLSTGRKIESAMQWRGKGRKENR